MAPNRIKPITHLKNFTTHEYDGEKFVTQNSCVFDSECYIAQNAYRTNRKFKKVIDQSNDGYSELVSNLHRKNMNDDTIYKNRSDIMIINGAKYSNGTHRGREVTVVDGFGSVYDHHTALCKTNPKLSSVKEYHVCGRCGIREFKGYSAWYPKEASINGGYKCEKCRSAVQVEHEPQTLVMVKGSPEKKKKLERYSADALNRWTKL